MKKSDLPNLPPFFDRYILLANDEDVVTALENSAGLFENEAVKQKLIALGDQVYAEGKWTAKDIVQHIIDTERIMAYRALRISRNDKTPLPGFDEEFFAQHTTAATRTLPELLAEFKLVRQSSVLLFESMSSEMLQREGISSNQPITALALGFVLVGHPIHHLNVLQERYFGLL
ncbi:MAG: DinB family protein [Cytophagia bacterium]|nr:MAG: DinB family protein [Runella sp.]TAG16448.1 MAG: DinB family protein [Cytophagales bacterium]TAG36414.1 MAG: DinB family protein [Cytophagia bacterium]TAG74070.1 MAG: DinB family protein [Runella slithyformis]TAG77476.1 MAG: DinB family protein [Cytophagales bacterium]